MEYSLGERAIIYLCACTQFDYRERAEILRAAGDPARLLSEDLGFLAAVKEERRSLFPALQARKAAINKLLSELENKGYFALTVLSPDYPEALKQIDEPPLVLFGAGNRELLTKRKFCIVGSRMTPSWAEALTKRIANEISHRFVVVTGLAEGGDLAAIEGARENALISVLPCGLNECYPAAHYAIKQKIKERGLLLSEYPLDEKVRTYSFHARNRILAGLSEGVLVVSAGRRSGTSITANRALDYGRDVFAFPYNAGVRQGEGCNELLKRGAQLVTGSEDILSFYGFDQAKAERPSLTQEEELVLQVLREEGELHTAVIAERTGLKVYEAVAALSSLEIKNLAVKSGGNRYSAL